MLKLEEFMTGELLFAKKKEVKQTTFNRIDHQSKK